jgi:hypothetical protein
MTPAFEAHPDELPEPREASCLVPCMTGLPIGSP